MPRRTDPGVEGTGPAEGTLRGTEAASPGPRSPQLSPASALCWGGGVGRRPSPAWPEGGAGKPARVVMGTPGAGECAPDISNTGFFLDMDLLGFSHLLLQDRPQFRTAFPISRARTVTAIGTTGFLLSRC